MDGSEWKPNEEFLAQLLEMGIPRQDAIEALLNTGNCSAIHAANYAFENPGRSDLNALQQENFKMVFIVDTQLGMSCGKTAAQVGHASLGLYQKLTASDKFIQEVSIWEQEGEKMIVLKGIGYQHLKSLEQAAELAHLTTYCVRDGGCTEVLPGSTTVLAIFGKETDVDKVTGELSLLR